jgi:Tol biopolymer transport system component
MGRFILHRKPAILGEGVISTSEDEFGGSLSPDGKTIYFDRSVPAHYLYTMWESHVVANKWQKPELMAISGQYRDSDPVLSPDGNTLLFVSDRPVEGVDRHHYEIWMCRRQGNKWSDPKNLGPVVNAHSQYFASMASNGNLYFSGTIADNDSEIDIFVSKFVNEEYTTPVNLGPAVNGKGIINIEAFISPDEKFLPIGAFNRPDSVGSSDIYASYNRDGNWSAPLPVAAINTPAREYSPRLSPDGKRIIFTTERGMGDGTTDQAVDDDGIRAEVALDLERAGKYLFGADGGVVKSEVGEGTEMLVFGGTCFCMSWTRGSASPRMNRAFSVSMAYLNLIEVKTDGQETAEAVRFPRASLTPS